MPDLSLQDLTSGVGSLLNSAEQVNFSRGPGGQVDRWSGGQVVRGLGGQVANNHVMTRC